MSQPIILTHGLTKTIGKKPVVDEVNLQINKGDIYGFLGPNGAGKTTTIRMLLGLIRPTKGDIQIFGKDLRKNKISILRRVGSLVEYPSYYGHLNAVENLEAVRRITGAAKSRIDEVLAIVRLTGEAKRAVKGYSLGMKQRLGIALALLSDPELLILDEPTNGLDPSGILEMRELIKRLPSEYGITVMVSSHLLSEIDQTAGKVGIISQGRLIFQDSIEALRMRSASSIRIQVDDVRGAHSLLLSKGCKADIEDGCLSVGNRSDEAVGAIVKELVHHRISVYRVQEEKRTLEQIFLELTGGEVSL
ncbi:ABC transporter ATP-binding protein [Paenibacillus thermotolerans]|uniref:ABC transporter ATP-binding protein n=1 Tax=Paenibacillus thermotolerans TaxID=3027807 RepID=UPI0023674938|nr:MULTISPECIES: ABC transporter ATP-binding protein [unclassified Paenibacillus]